MQSQQTYYHKQKSPGIAALRYFLFTGLGQIYNGQIGKGIAFLIIGIVIAVSSIFLVPFSVYPIFWIYNIHDPILPQRRSMWGFQGNKSETSFS